ncbi:MAG TPA: hypothetical protein VFX70_17005 [Mycobacteriales bacterium]|nr:hypothetical protein [Mycobacteriales bacterium]
MRRPTRRGVADAQRRMLFPPKVVLAVGTLLLATATLAAAICLVVVDGYIALWLFVTSGVLGLVGLVLGVRYRIAGRTKADEEPRTR